ncbi:MAG: hypothetical protein NZT92_05490 [Abditibacteriales bacterium]|nr:hypothetical protein [Abditibacteriales bacterium]MDW8365419.1 hypothetical protein [Abditibacteriales bacterium]
MKPLPVVFAIASVLLLAARGVWSQVEGFKVEVSKAAAPADLPENIKKMLSRDCFKVSGADGKVLAEIWWGNAVTARELPIKHGDNMQVLFGLPEGAFLGVLRLHKAAVDYKGGGVKEGVFTMRYLTQPADGNHLGTAPFNDFAVLFLPKNDPGTPDGDRDALIKVALTQAAHPFAMGLAVPKMDTACPSLAKGEENNLVVFCKFTAKAGDKTEEVKVGLMPGFKVK